MSNPSLTINELSVPTQNSSDNNYIQDVVGNKTDGHSGNSLIAIAHTLEEHVHKEARCYPNLANGITMTAGAGAWNLGTITEIIPASTITDDYDIHYISVEDISANDVYQIILYYGSGDVFAGETRFTRSSVQSNTFHIPIITPVMPANDRVRAQLASASGNNNAVISLFYHTY